MNKQFFIRKIQKYAVGTYQKMTNYAKIFI